MPQGGVEGPFLYLLAMLPLMSWIAREYPQLARAPHTSPAQAYVDDAVPMARNEKDQQVVQDLMQRYGRDNHLVWSAESSAALRRGGEEGMALDVGDRVAWLERAEEAVDAEQDVPQSGRGGETAVLSRGRRGSEGGEHVPALCVAPAQTVGGGEEGVHVARPTGSVAEEEHMLATNRTCGKRGPILVLDTDFGGAAHGTVPWIRKEGVSMEVLHVRRKDMEEYKKAGLHHAELYRDTRVVEWGVYRWMMRRAPGQEDRAR